MDFGLFFLMQRDEAWTEQAVYESALEQMLAAEGLGYGSVWIAEHHFNDYGLCPAPPVLASYLAARTRTLRLGMGVSLLPLHHPVDLAEQLAVLDVVSGGRLDVGIGRGGTLQDYQTFQSDRGDSRARVEEGIALMRECWSSRPFSFQGRFHAAERLHVRPCLRSARIRRSSSPRTARTACARPRASACPRCPPTSCRRMSWCGGTRCIATRRAPRAARRRRSSGSRGNRGHASGAREPHPRRGAPRHRGAVHGLSAADRDAALRGPGRRAPGFVRPLAGTAAPLPRLSSTTAWR